jgi:hypothetical protein
VQHVESSEWLPYDAQTIYECLTNPDSLAKVVKRIDRISVIDREGDSGSVQVVLDLPARKVVETTGQVSGTPYEQLTFRTDEPFPLEFAWKLTPDADGGTQVVATLGVDLSSYGIPMAGLLVRSIISSELKDDLGRLRDLMAAG